MRSSYLIAGAALLLGTAGLARPLAQTQTATPAASQTQTAAAPARSAAGGNVEHGRYLVENVAMCGECHSPRDDQGNIIESQRYFGGPMPVRPPWPNDWAVVVPRNRGLPGYDDDQAMRLLMDGAIGRDGRQLRLPMPRFHMSRQDAADVIAFMRSLP